MITESVERFDRTADGYLRWWAPVLAPASVRLMDRLEAVDHGLTGGRPLDAIDIGCGTGNLLFGAARRWPSARLVGLDASTGMLTVARRKAASLPDSVRARISFVMSDAANIPAPDASFDLVMSAFMIQQVPDRAAVLGELHRISKPDGFVAIAGWLTEKTPFEPEAVLEEVLAKAGVVRPAPRDANRAISSRFGRPPPSFGTPAFGAWLHARTISPTGGRPRTSCATGPRRETWICSSRWPKTYAAGRS